MNSHLNAFKFFSDTDSPYYENNLSRAFALCLMHDALFLDKVLRAVLTSDQYKANFGYENAVNGIEIDLQRRVNELDTYGTVVGVACSGQELKKEQYDSAIPWANPEPETDVLIAKDDLCIIFEFKRTNIDCTGQLKGQLASIAEVAGRPLSEYHYSDLNWHKIVQIMLNILSLQNHSPLLRDFRYFLEARHAAWFPTKLLLQISYPLGPDDPNHHYLYDRLYRITLQMAPKLNGEVGWVPGSNQRLPIKLNWHWSRELHLEYKRVDEKPCIVLRMHPGDTKAQGWHLLRNAKNAIEWPDEIQAYQLRTTPYLKFSHFNAGIFWYQPNDERYRLTHTWKFFQKNAGRWKRERWQEFEKVMNEMDVDWQEDEQYQSKLLASNRSYFDLSMGITLELYVPWEEIRELDNIAEESEAAIILTQLALEFKKSVDSQTSK